MTVLTRDEVRTLLDALWKRDALSLPYQRSVELELKPPDTAVEFTNAIFAAAGLDVESVDNSWYRRIRDLVAEAFYASETERLRQHLGITSARELMPNKTIERTR